MMRLSKRQAQTLEVIRGFIIERGYPPTLREIGRRMDIGSTNGVNDHLLALERKGAISRDPMVSRGIRVLVPPPPRDIFEMMFQRAP